MIRGLLRHKEVFTTMLCMYVLKKGRRAVKKSRRWIERGACRLTHGNKRVSGLAIEN